MQKTKQKKKHPVKKTASRQADNTSKIIFNEPVLMAQFLRDYSNIPLLKEVQPEDIEDVSERFTHIFSEEREADTVKRVKLSNNIPFLVECQSKFQ